MTAVDEATKAQIDRILNSEVLKSSAALKRLLSFLADKALLGEADTLKEYSIGIDAFGKPASYDPRQDSTVRIQAARLRHKLAEYYQSEGKEDPIVVDLPKGHYKLNWSAREPRTEALVLDARTARSACAAGPGWRWILVGASAALIAAVSWGVYSTVELREERASHALFRSQWTREIAALWQPFMESERPVLISIGTPLFVELPGIGYFRDPAVNTPDAIEQSKTVAELQRALQVAHVQPMAEYASLGGAHAAFTLGRLLGSRKANTSTISGNELSWRQMSENNVILIGRPRFFRLNMSGLPVKPELDIDEERGVRNLNPRSGEPALFVNETSGTTGITYAVVSLTPGPEGNTNVMDFFARNGAGMTGALAWFTNPDSARSLVAKLGATSGRIPRYYQVLLKIRFQDRVPLETSYVLHRELHPIVR
ncbi:MAG TPA: hypothetical protein VKX49_32410 [Bryobacteraceae bacterium]|nr:hypothetical protein [Bryobacteraceae bacterium]